MLVAVDIDLQEFDALNQKRRNANRASTTPTDIVEECLSDALHSNLVARYRLTKIPNLE